MCRDIVDTIYAHMACDASGHHESLPALKRKALQVQVLDDSIDCRCQSMLTLAPSPSVLPSLITSAS